MFKELDLNGVRVYSNTKRDIIDALDLVGQEVYLSSDDDFSPYYYKGKLKGINYTGGDEVVFIGETDTAIFLYKYFILVKDAKFKGDKKLRPFKDINEFSRATGRGIGDIVPFKRKDSATEYNLLFSGYEYNILFSEYSPKRGEVLLYLGQGCYTFKELCDDYLFYNANYNEWKPFGIEE